ncbi:hypothetical protein A5789_04165 [Nocardia sp. 852002-51101_SCH5132738]|nr:hypothetical protein A5789_04165 [Nocardia sp. 852002-51101_SCH5132738]OBF72704.1 hypothetical protein A9X06_27980 [Mycobacterium sp. 852002-51759_SCH5129042]
MVSMSADRYPGFGNPTSNEQLGVELASEQLDLILDMREIRLERGYSVTQVAEAMGVDPAQVSRFESGATNPTMSTIRRYAKAVGAIFRIRAQRWEAENDESFESTPPESSDARCEDMTNAEQLWTVRMDTGDASPGPWKATAVEQLGRSAPVVEPVKGTRDYLHWVTATVQS